MRRENAGARVSAVLLSEKKPSKDYRQCTRCVMDTTDPMITFDLKGRCRHCSDFLEKKARHGYRGPESDRALDRLIDEIKLAGRDRPYDCVVGVSGGVDSSYLAHIANERGLRALAVHLDNGWDSEKAVLNIKSVVDTLGLDYESYVLDWEEFRDLQLAFLRASVPEAETPTDVAIPAALHRVAAKHNVRYILSGGNFATEGIIPASWHYNAKDLKYLRHIHKTFGSGRLPTFPTFDYKTEIYYKLVRGIRTVYPLNLVPFSQEEAVAHLAKYFCWNNYGEKHHESRYTKFVQSYYIYEKFGIDYRRMSLSIGVCQGKMERCAADEILKRKPYRPDELARDKRYIIKKLGISHEEMENIVRRPAKWYWDYPNDRKKLTRVYDAYRAIYGKDKMDRF